MSVNDRKGICQILNRTNFRIIAWYFDPKNTRKTGLKHFELLYKAPMLSTGNEKFTCYVYYKTKLYSPEEKDEWLDSETSDADEEEEEDDEEEEEGESKNSEEEDNQGVGVKRQSDKDVVKLEAEVNAK